MSCIHSLPDAAPAPQRWDIFCRVIDNFGDVGVCWRLAADLADRGLHLRLFIDDARALCWMAPAGHPHVQVLAWPRDDVGPPAHGAADVVIEAFGCNPPHAYVQAMTQRWGAAPVWINLEYLSAEDYVERSHGLPSPQRCGLTKWFFYPGFTPRTGGLLREPDLPTRQAACSRSDALRRLGIDLQPGERLVSLFAYPNLRLDALLQALAARPTCLLLMPGQAQAARHWLAGRVVPDLRVPDLRVPDLRVPDLRVPDLRVPGLRLHGLPWQTQVAYDDLLWTCDLNFVRGEDSLVRALWARRPFVWQAYPQHDGAQHAKVLALLRQAQLGPGVAALWQWWNGSPAAGTTLPAPAAQALTDLPVWQPQLSAWVDRLQQQEPLAVQLMAFAHAKSTAATLNLRLRPEVG